MQQSSPVLQQLRTLHHPGTLQHLQQSPDGALYPHPHPQAIPLYQQQYALSGDPQPSPHALQYQQHGLPPSSAQYPAAFPTTYQHASSPRFAVANPPPLPIQHFQQQVPLPPAPPLRAAPQASPQREAPVRPLQPLPQAQAQPLPEPQAHGRETDDAPSSNHGQFQGLKLIADPPDLEAWRQRLFDVDDTMTLSEEE
tara:strand:- start:26139 stop:26729 length:591 start_codon:yes stop_codon:yes gene_type:complete